MKRYTVLALLLLSACNQQQGGEPVIRQDISGDEIRDISDEGEVPAVPQATKAPAFASACTPHIFEQVLLTDCVADPEKTAISTILSPENGSPFRSLAALEQSIGADNVVFAVNAGMFDGEGKPIGYYVENSNRLTELNRADGTGNFFSKPNGVFFGTNGNWRVLSADQFFATVKDRPQFGTQSGPMLVIDGELHPDIQEDGPSKAIRNGVGIDEQGRAHFVISEAPLSFGKFARFYRDELKVKNALFLDGNVSALWDPAKGRQDSGSPIGPMIVVSRKAGPAQESVGE